MQEFQSYLLLIYRLRFALPLLSLFGCFGFRLRWRASTCGRIYARVYCILYYTCTMSSFKNFTFTISFADELLVHIADLRLLEFAVHLFCRISWKFPSHPITFHCVVIWSHFSLRKLSLFWPINKEVNRNSTLCSFPISGAFVIRSLNMIFIVVSQLVECLN